jgi:hypothetical protein
MKLTRFLAMRHQLPSLCLYLAISPIGILSSPPTQAQQRNSLSDEDILNPKNLVFDRVVPFMDSFDGSRVGTVFVSKRAILAHPKQGIFGEANGSFYPPGTDEIDASYVYFVQKKGECVLGVRWIGWGEKVERMVNNKRVEIGHVRYQSVPTNISYIVVNGSRIGPPINQSQLAAPNGTNYKYYPRRQSSWPKTIMENLIDGIIDGIFGLKRTYEFYSSTNEGYITDIHYFPAQELLKAIRQNQDVIIEMPNWLPSRHLISGEPLAEVRKLAATCTSD